MASVYLITPLTPECGDWLRENVSEDTMYLGLSLAVERRYVEGLILGLQEHGFKWERDFEIIY
ncbi:MAG: hypothetical protein ABIJ44_09020 [Pseudomonadota bacterium]